MLAPKWNNRMAKLTSPPPANPDPIGFEVRYDPSAIAIKHPQVFADLKANAQIARSTPAELLAGILKERLGKGFDVRPITLS